MTEKRFNMIIIGADGSFYYHDNVTDEKITSTLELENKLNELHEENEKLKEKNRRLEYKTVDMLDYIKEKGTVTHQEMKEWWNTMMTGGDVE